MPGNTAGGGAATGSSHTALARAGGLKFAWEQIVSKPWDVLGEAVPADVPSFCERSKQEKQGGLHLFWFFS